MVTRVSRARRRVRCASQAFDSDCQWSALSSVCHGRLSRQRITAQRRPRADDGTRIGPTNGTKEWDLCVWPWHPFRGCGRRGCCVRARHLYLLEAMRSRTRRLGVQGKPSLLQLGCGRSDESWPSCWAVWLGDPQLSMPASSGPSRMVEEIPVRHALRSKQRLSLTCLARHPDICHSTRSSGHRGLERVSVAHSKGDCFPLLPSLFFSPQGEGIARLDDCMLMLSLGVSPLRLPGGSEAQRQTLKYLHRMAG
ncbi:hypothetical protein B0I35DRAFT_188869 [Stachybotrys elegans]|uniref:Uncharacterized protein n=1 Tax=Stachybotrys elegans TaxID=80388 RepID=A0A8K0SUK3_9HYPO|nr:hypothetical protein B0I35DRAFT_188869 [Stachybotrys elegans]